MSEHHEVGVPVTKGTVHINVRTVDHRGLNVHKRRQLQREGREFGNFLYGHVSPDFYTALRDFLEEFGGRHE